MSQKPATRASRLRLSEPIMLVNCAQFACYRFALAGACVDIQYFHFPVPFSQELDLLCSTTHLFRYVDDQHFGILYSRQLDAVHITNLGAIALLE